MLPGEHYPVAFFVVSKAREAASMQEVERVVDAHLRFTVAAISCCLSTTFWALLQSIIVGAGAARFPLDPQPNSIGCVAWCFCLSACVGESLLLRGSREDSLPV